MAKKKKREKKQEVKKEEKLSIEEEKKQERQVKWVMIITILVIGLFIASYFLIGWYKYTQSYFDYDGVRWFKTGTKEMISYRGDINFPWNPGFGLYLRNDPRTNNVSVGNISFKFYQNVTTSYDSDLESCYEAVLSQVNLVYFLRAGFGFNVAPAIFNKTQAEEKNIDFADCTSANNKTVILLRKSETPSIEQDINKDCYIINVGDCENLKSTERFMLVLISAIKSYNSTATS